MAESSMASAYHNYLVEGRLHREWVAGSPQERLGFSLLAHQVLPGDPMPLVSGRFFGPRGEFLLRMERNALVENPNGFTLLETRGSWVLMDTSLEGLLSAEIRAFENAYLTILRGILYGADGKPAVQGDDEGLHLLL